MASSDGDGDGDCSDGAEARPSSQKRRVPNSLRFADDSDEEKPEQAEKKLKATLDVESFKCSICLYVWHDVVCVSPCQHNFCNACFSEWFLRCQDSTCKCPECRCDMVFASKNHAMRSLVEDLLANNPSLRRPPEELAKMNQEALVGSSFLTLDARTTALYGPLARSRAVFSRPISASSSNDDDSDDTGSSDEEEEPGPSCRQCRANSSTFSCQPGTHHLVCQKCFREMPERNDLDVPQNCAACAAACCDAYWRSQSLPTSLGEIGCPSGRLQSMSERQIVSMPREAHSSNTVEQEFTKQYLDQKGLTVECVIRSSLGEVDNYDRAGQNRRITSATAICDTCANKVAAYLLDKFRMLVPKADMPAEAARRDDCWYGYACRTQRHNIQHAKKLNHVCEPTSRNVVL